MQSLKKIHAWAQMQDPLFEKMFKVADLVSLKGDDLFLMLRVQ